MEKKKEISRWNYRPEIPIPLSPILSWPPRPLAWIRWISRYWLAISAVTLTLLSAIIVYNLTQPEWQTMQELTFDWVFTIWLRNMILLSVVAGGLHLWFIKFSAQGSKLKFDSRDQARNNRTFTLKNQVLDNMFWCYASGVTAWTVWEVLYFWCAANGYAPTFEISDNPVWFVAFFILLPLWSSFHFYWIHRFLHWPPLYRIAHNVHHRNVNIGPWSGISMHPVETAIFFSSIIIHFVLPTHPTHLLFHIYLNGIHPAFSHSGFEAVYARDKKRLNTGDFFHQLHHRYFECNYGTSEMPWDKLFGSFHDGSEEATLATKERRSQMYGNSPQN